MKLRRLFVSLLAVCALGAATAQSVTFYTAGPGNLANRLAAAFTDATGIAVDVYQATSGDVLARLEAERGNPRADVVVLASWGEGLDLVNRGWVNSDVVVPGADALRSGWVSGGLYAQGAAALAIVVNTLEVSEDQYPTVWADLLDPFWAGQLTAPDPSLSGSAAEFFGGFTQVHGEQGWDFIAQLARGGLLVPGPNNAALNPVLTGERLATFAAVDYISYNSIASGEALAVVYPEDGTVLALRPALIQAGAPNADLGVQFLEFMLSEEGQAIVAGVNLIPSLPSVAAQRPVPGEFVALDVDNDLLAEQIGAVIQRFNDEIVTGIIQGN